MGHANEEIFDLEAHLNQLSEEEKRQVQGFVQSVLEATGRTDKEAYERWSKLHKPVVGGMDVRVDE